MLDFNQPHADPSERRARSLTDGFSLEVPLAKAARFEPDASVFPLGSLVFLPHLRNQTASELAAACRLIVARGYAPVPHIGARHLPTEGSYRDLLAAAADNGARQLLLLAGDAEAARGPYGTAEDLIRSPHFDQAPFRHVMISGYPEGHPRISPDALTSAMAAKLRLLAKRECEATIVSQFAFDPAAYLRWLAALRREGVDQQVRLGVAGVTSLTKLIRFAKLCGVGASLSMLRKRGSDMFAMLGGYHPGSLIAAIEAASRAQDLGDFRLHFFPFGGAGETLDWLGAQPGWRADD